MTKKTTVVDDMIQGVKRAASKIVEVGSEAAGINTPRKLYERIVPVPQIDTYSELPFALVETADDSSAKPEKKTKPKSPKKKTAAAKAKKSVKKSVKRQSSRTK